MGALRCANKSCATDLPRFADAAMGGDGGGLLCPLCGLAQHAFAFSALNWERPRGAKAESVVVDGEATCFDHPEKVAVQACDGCGVYLCDLCDIELDQGHFCPKCFAKGKEDNPKFIARAVMYDDIFLGVAVVATLICTIGALIAPFMLVATALCWKKVKTPYPRSRWRFVVAGIIFLLRTVGTVFFIVLLVTGAID